MHLFQIFNQELPFTPFHKGVAKTAQLVYIRPTFPIYKELIMKKTFSVHAENKTAARQVDAIKYEIKKYVQRERRKDLPERSDFWDFQCKAGSNQEKAEALHLKELNPKIDELVQSGHSEFYIEIIAEAKTRTKKGTD